MSGQSRLTGCLAAAPCSNPGASESLRGERGVSYCFELGDLASTYRAKTGQHLLSARSTGRGSRGPFDSLALPASAVSKTSGIARSWTGDLPISGWAALAKNGTRAAAEVCPGRRSALALAATVAGCGALEGPAAAPGSVVDVLLVWSLSLMAVVVSWKAVIAHLRPTPGLSCRLCRIDQIQQVLIEAIQILGITLRSKFAAAGFHADLARSEHFSVSVSASCESLLLFVLRSSPSRGSQLACTSRPESNAA